MDRAEGELVFSDLDGEYQVTGEKFRVQTPTLGDMLDELLGKKVTVTRETINGLVHISIVEMV